MRVILENLYKHYNLYKVMFKKWSVLILFLFLTASVIAQSNSSNNSNQNNPPAQTSGNVIDKAYQCLKTQVDNKVQNTISLQEAVFGTLALGSNSKLVSVIEGKAVGGNHWAESSSQIKDTAQVLLAYDRINKNTDTIETWLKSNRKTATDLTWYLEIDIQNHVASQCTVSYGNEQRPINVNDDMTLSGNPGSCLTIAASSFWLRVSNNCIDQNFTVSCDQDFITTTLYQRSGSSTIFVSPTAHSAAALGTTQENINSKCFSTTNSCDYEGTLWAALALDNANNDVSDYLPYLLALGESNQRFLPSGFLYKLTNGQDQYSQLVQSQQQSKYWQAPNTPYNRYYDSALALLALQGSSATEADSSKEYFEIIPTAEGCWNNNNIRDTGFLLYAGWPRSATPGSGPEPGPSQDCDDRGYTCTTIFVCNDLGGSVFEEYDCSSGVCCSKEPTAQTCAEQNGQICQASESCSGTTASSSDGSCCLGTCSPLSQADACEQAGGSCYTSCNDNEEQVSETCDDTNNICCKPKSTTDDGSINWTLWIIILATLIVLIIVGILMRNKLKLAFYKSQSSSGLSSRPGFPPGGRPPFLPARGPIPMMRGAPPRFIPGQGATPQRRPGISSSDAEMEETMRKLKEMSK